MSLSTLASSHVHKILAELIEKSEAPPGEPITVSEKSETHAFQVVVTIAHYAPMRLHPGTVAKIDAMNDERPAVRLTDGEQEIISILNFEKPTKGAVIATKLGKDFASLRKVLAVLSRFGIIRRCKGGGYVKAG